MDRGCGEGDYQWLCVMKIALCFSPGASFKCASPGSEILTLGAWVGPRDLH